jgi:hypothetical protein
MFRRVSNSIICVSCTAQSEVGYSLSLRVRETEGTATHGASHFLAPSGFTWPSAFGR